MSPSNIQSIFQFGRETTPGVAVPADIRLISRVKAQDERLIIIPPGFDSLAAGVSRFVHGNRVARIVTPEQSLTFQEICVFLDAAIGRVTPDLEVASLLYKPFGGAIGPYIPGASTFAAGDELYVGSESPYRGIHFLLSGVGNTSLGSFLTHHSHTSGWSTQVNYDDSKYLARTGVVELMPPNVGGWGQITLETLFKYWIRLTFWDAPTDPVIVSAIKTVPLAVRRLYTLTGVPPAFDTYSIETGVPGNIIQTAFSFCRAFTCAMASPVNEWRYMSEWTGNDYASIAGTDGEPQINQEDIQAALTKFYCGSPGGAIAIASQTLISFRLLLRSGLMELRTANGTQFYQRIVRDAPTVSLSMTLEDNAWLQNERALRNTRQYPPERDFRFVVTGTDITPGVPNRVTIDTVGTWLSLSAPYPDEFDDLVVDAEVDARFEPQAGLRVQFEVINARAAIP